jgi:probable F420-dependent oxidoreductase
MSEQTTAFPQPSPATTLLGKLGVWSNFDHLPGPELIAFACRSEALGVDALWVQEGAGREPFATLGRLLGETERIAMGVGIASIYARDAAASHAAARTLAEMAGGRFVLGLGVSHVFRVEGQRGHNYLPPLPTMRAYLEAYRSAPYEANRPGDEPPVVLAALRRRMLELAAVETDGAFPYFVPAEYVAKARETLDRAAADAGSGTRPSLVTAVAAILESDRSTARAIARTFTGRYLTLPNYVNNLAESGFDAPDLEPPGSDRLVDAIVALGRAADLRRRVDEFRSAGADHVAIIPIGPEGRQAHLPTIEALMG